jgi:hypothetical protein
MEQKAQLLWGQPLVARMISGLASDGGRKTATS